jgi:hypothetical protein
MKKLSIFFITSILLIGISLTCANARYVEVSKDKIISINIQTDQITFLNQLGIENTSNADADQIASKTNKSLKNFRRISKCAKSKVVVIDKKSILKASLFKSDMELCKACLNANGLDNMSLDDIYNLTISASETIHKTYLVTLRSFLL